MKASCTCHSAPDLCAAGVIERPCYYPGQLLTPEGSGGEEVGDLVERQKHITVTENFRIGIEQPRFQQREIALGWVQAAPRA